MARKYRSFLGANTPRGFVSFFDELYNPYHDSKAYIIKGGPGTGKSTFMKNIGEKADSLGYDTEWIYCSSDPKSLDGLIIPELNFSIADGTAPHVLEPKFPGAVENIVNLGQFWDEKELHKKSGEIRSLTIENSMYHRRSARFLMGAGAVDEESRRLIDSHLNKEKINSFAVRFVSRELPNKKQNFPGKKKRRFLSAITPKGNVFFTDTIEAMATRIIGIEDSFGCVSGAVLERIGEMAVLNGYDIICCHCPMKPNEYCEHLIIPEKKLCLVTIEKKGAVKLNFERIIHVGRFLTDDVLFKNKQRLAFNKKITKELTDESVALLKKAKATHDKLEECYISAMDFPSKEDFTKKFIEKIFSE